MEKISKILNENYKDNEDFNSTIRELKNIIKELPEMRWNIVERGDNEDYPYSYFGDEWDTWNHLEENERAEYFGKIFSTVKKLKDKIESL